VSELKTQAKITNNELIKDVRFGKIIINICRGYVDESRKKNRIISSQALEDIYHNGLTYFFRLLFLMLAVSRRRFNGALHLEDIISKSMTLLNNGSLDQNSFSIWSDLQKVFTAVQVNTKNMLFYSHKYSKLVDGVKICDKYLAPVLFYLKNIETDLGIKLRDLNERIIGALYEQWLEQSLIIENNDLQFDGNKNQRRQSGSYYTPEYIVDYIVKNTVGEKIKSIKKQIKKGSIVDNQSIVNLLEDVKVLDPAMGSGHFLLSAANFITGEIVNLPKRYFSGDKAQGVDRELINSLVFQHCIYGVDLNSLAVELTKFSFFLAGYSHESSLLLYDHKFKCGNSLIDNDLIVNNAFHWKKEFPEVYTKNDGFDCIIGNPPYGNLLTHEEKSYIQYNYPNPKDKIGDNIVKPFINRAHQLLGDGGYLSFIIPKSLIFVSGWQDSRLLLLQHLNLLEIADNGRCFSGVLLEMITFAAQKSKRKKDEIRVVKLDSPKPNRSNSLVETVNLPLKYFSKECFVISIANKQELQLFEKIENISVPLEKIAHVFVGWPLNKQLHSTPDMDNPVKTIRGKHIVRGHLRGFDYMDASFLPLNSMRGDIVVQEIVSHLYEPQPRIKLIGALNPDNLFSVNTVTNIKLKAETSLSSAYILAMLHTELLNLYIYRMIYINSFRTMHFSTKYAQKTPIPILPDEKMGEIAELFEQFCSKYPDNKVYEVEIEKIFEDYLGGL
jgi:hypothetical protein